jgi:thiol:disulfide interchange protein DsbD
MVSVQTDPGQEYERDRICSGGDGLVQMKWCGGNTPQTDSLRYMKKEIRMLRRALGCSIAAFLSICFLSVAGFGQSSADYVKTSTALSVDKVKQGSSFQIAVVVDINPGYHVNSNKPSEEFLIPTSLKVEKTTGLTIAPVLYPAGQSKKFSFDEKPLSVYEGKVILRFRAVAASSLSPGAHELHSTLKIQACSNEACFQPKDIRISIQFEVVDANAKTNSVNGDIFGAAHTRKR